MRRDGPAAGHADIIRELIDGAAGDNDGNLAELSTEKWQAYRLRLEQAAIEAAAGPSRAAE